MKRVYPAFFYVLMCMIFKKLFKCNSEEETLRKEIEDLKDKLNERQDVINKTNAYWKKKMHQVKQNKQRN